MAADIVDVAEQRTLGKAFQGSIAAAPERREPKASKVNIKGTVALDGFVKGQSLDDYSAEAA